MTNKPIYHMCSDIGRYTASLTTADRQHMGRLLRLQSLHISTRPTHLYCFPDDKYGGLLHLVPGFTSQVSLNTHTDSLTTYWLTIGTNTSLQRTWQHQYQSEDLYCFLDNMCRRLLNKILGNTRISAWQHRICLKTCTSSLTIWAEDFSTECLAT